MNKFALHTRISMGPQASGVLKELAGKSVFIVTDSFMATTPYMECVKGKLGDAKITMFDQVTPNPSIEVVTAGLSLFLEAQPDVVLAIGGGSPIDAAKAINKIAAEQEHNAGNAMRGAPMGVWVIPTTSGSGSEVTSFAVITNEHDQSKIPLISQDMLPKVAILDPDAVVTAPGFLTADSGMDAITHAIEAIISLEANDFTDAMAEKALRLLFANLPAAYSHGSDLQVRERVHNGACMAGLAFENAGLGIVHSLSHAIGGHFHVAHGRINAILLPHVIAFNADVRGFSEPPTETARRFARICDVLDLQGANPAVMVQSLIRAIKQLNQHLDIPDNIIACKVDKDAFISRIPEMANLALHDACTGTNPRNVTVQDLEMLLHAITKSSEAHTKLW